MLIAKEIFVINSGISWILIFNIHNVLSYVCLGVILLHILLHAKYLVGVLKKLPKALPGKEMKSAIRRFAAGVFAAVILYSSISVCKNISDKQNFPNEHDFVKDKNTVSTKPKNNSIVDTQSELSAIEESSSYVIEDEKPPVSDNPNDESITSQTETTPPPTLEEYLSGLTCEGCPRRYSLLTPRCTRGQAKAEQAEEEYYQIYAENGITG